MTASTDHDKEMLRQAGKLLGRVLRDTAAQAKAGVSAAKLDEFAEAEIRKGGATPVFLNYQTDDAPYPYPASLCVSLNDEIVHSLPTQEKILKAGDVVSLDLGLSYGGYIVDAATTLIVGEGDEDAKRLLEGTQEALKAAIRAAKAGGFAGDIGAVVAETASKYHLSVIRDLGGHGTGRHLHEPPFIENFGTKGTGEKLKSGMVLALEPIFALGSGALKVGEDGWTYRTKDGSRAAQFEHTILVGEKGAEILTA